jgi:hypothetical protein
MAVAAPGRDSARWLPGGVVDGGGGRCGRHRRRGGGPVTQPGARGRAGPGPALLLGYAGCSEQEIRTGVRKVRVALTAHGRRLKAASPASA